ncbi:MAG: ABC transporter ATP-binding protein [Alphaproteobacteria bacterium]|nr:MAG: ABC transporter ATP-binding protein [Alphaproteobacteria bacterium]
MRGISFDVKRGQVFGVVGESGCGKTATGRALIRLVPPPGRIAEGRILYHGEDLLAKPEAAMRSLRGRRIAMVFQDPSAALNPVFTVGQQLVGIMHRHGVATGIAARRRALDLLGELGLPSPADMFGRYPHQLSGGMQQRVMLSMALAADPDLIIADEATTALDVTVQAQIVELLLRLQRERGLTIIFITHDLGLVAEICDHVAVLYLGRIVEEGDTDSIFHDTRHPYTRGLLAALPSDKTWGKPLNVIPGSVPTATKDLPGCSFAPRCPAVMEICRIIDPATATFSAQHKAACHLYPVEGARDA